MYDLDLFKRMSGILPFIKASQICNGYENNNSKFMHINVTRPDTGPRSGM